MMARVQAREWIMALNSAHIGSCRRRGAAPASASIKHVIIVHHSFTTEQCICHKLTYVSLSVSGDELPNTPQRSRRDAGKMAADSEAVGSGLGSGVGTGCGLGCGSVAGLVAGVAVGSPKFCSRPPETTVVPPRCAHSPGGELPSRNVQPPTGRPFMLAAAPDPARSTANSTSGL